MSDEYSRRRQEESRQVIESAENAFREYIKREVGESGINSTKTYHCEICGRKAESLFSCSWCAREICESCIGERWQPRVDQRGLRSVNFTRYNVQDTFSNTLHNLAILSETKLCDICSKARLEGRGKRILELFEEGRIRRSQR
jgi:hypothetical protein